MMEECRSGLAVLGFAHRKAFERWLAHQAIGAPGVWVKLAKLTAKTASISRAESIDAALCHGWIDGQVVSYDNDFYLTRFTPRRPRSKWSMINRTRAEELIAVGRMLPSGMAQIEAARADGRWDAAYPPASKAVVPEDLRIALEKNPNAAAFFATLTGSKRYAVLYGIATVKRAETRARKIARFVDRLACGKTV